jgi:hypothetical protein
LGCVLRGFFAAPFATGPFFAVPLIFGAGVGFCVDADNFAGAFVVGGVGFFAAAGTILYVGFGLFVLGFCSTEIAPLDVILIGIPEAVMIVDPFFS